MLQSVPPRHAPYQLGAQNSIINMQTSHVWLLATHLHVVMARHCTFYIHWRCWGNLFYCISKLKHNSHHFPSLFLLVKSCSFMNLTDFCLNQFLKLHEEQCTCARPCSFILQINSRVKSDLHFSPRAKLEDIPHLFDSFYSPHFATHLTGMSVIHQDPRRPKPNKWTCWHVHNYKLFFSRRESDWGWCGWQVRKKKWLYISFCVLLTQLIVLSYHCGANLPTHHHAYYHPPLNSLFWQPILTKRNSREHGVGGNRWQTSEPLTTRVVNQVNLPIATTISKNQQN